MTGQLFDWEMEILRLGIANFLPALVSNFTGAPYIDASPLHTFKF